MKEEIQLPFKNKSKKGNYFGHKVCYDCNQIYDARFSLCINCGSEIWGNLWSYENLDGKIFVNELKKISSKEELKQKIYRLNWIKILDEAIKGRSTSWAEHPVHEWRNASDEVCMALIRHMEEEDILNKTSYEMKRSMNEIEDRRKRNKI